MAKLTLPKRKEKEKAAKDVGSKAYNKLAGRDIKESLAYRDVFENQQVQRSKIDPVKSKTPWTIFAGVLSLLLAFAVWAILAYITNFWHGIMSQDSVLLNFTNTTPEEMAAHAAAHREGAAAILTSFGLYRFLAALGTGAIAFGFLNTAMTRNVDVQNLKNDVSDINQEEGDQRITLPDEIPRKNDFDMFPDTGAHSPVQASSIMSHMMLKDKGLKKVAVTQRAEKDIVDPNDPTNVLQFKGEPLRDDKGNLITKMMPIIDTKFGEELYAASGMGRKELAPLRRWFDTTTIPYNPNGDDLTKNAIGNYKTYAEVINATWTFPDYEVQRPAGAYIVDTAPVNTMVIAITRGGKGQTYIEPMLDIWLREDKPSNMVVNDPKGELLARYYVRASFRGYQVVQFNLINVLNTDIYNPLGGAAQAAREGDMIKCAAYVENIADVFFPNEGGDNAMWASAASNAFKRAAFGMIDFYLEEERELRAEAYRTGMHVKVLEQKLNEMWGRVTLYNCYQFFVQLSAKKLPVPSAEIETRMEAGEFGEIDDEGNFESDEMADLYEAAVADANIRSELWEGEKEMDMLTLHFNASARLPVNEIRVRVRDSDNALKSMAGSDKMLASVYGIAITAMSFFTDPTISTLTSGTPAQNIDLGGLSFPRRLGVRFGSEFMEQEGFVGQQVFWNAYSDPEFTQDLGEAFEHKGIIGRDGWARYLFEGIFPTDVAYLRLMVRNTVSGMLLRTYRFKFTKGYQTSFSGRQYIKDPVMGTRIALNGVMIELVPGEVVEADGTTRSRYVPGTNTYPRDRLVDIASGKPRRVRGESPVMISTSVRYSEQPKMLFLVTPPHLMKYAKIILILLKQLVDLNFDMSYTSKDTQKPLYRTRFMLDELGNLQSDGAGISGFETMLSIGLGQEQQFTLILQTIAQLNAVYGDGVDKILQGNIANIIFLKSTDDTMIEQLEKMSGKTHKSRRSSKSVTEDVGAMVKMTNVDSKISYTVSTEERPVITFTDMMFLAARQSIVFRAGDAVIWNRNETILPMSWRLFMNDIKVPGQEKYSLLTVPTLSTAKEFDIRKNQPDFMQMVNHRMNQVAQVDTCKELYRNAYELSEADVAALDQELYSNGVMELVDASLREIVAKTSGKDPDAVTQDEVVESEPMMISAMQEDEEMEARIAEQAIFMADHQKPRYGRFGGEFLISRDMLVGLGEDGALGDPRPYALEEEIIEAVKGSLQQIRQDTRHFTVRSNGDVYDASNTYAFVVYESDENLIERMRIAQEQEGRVFGDVENEDDMEGLGVYMVQGIFRSFLASQQNWTALAGGEFERRMVAAMRAKEDRTLEDR